MAENLLRSSALSIDEADVPMILTPACSMGIARLFGVWPPMLMMTPSTFSSSTMSITRSREISSK